MFRHKMASIHFSQEVIQECVLAKRKNKTINGKRYLKDRSLVHDTVWGVSVRTLKVDTETANQPWDSRDKSLWGSVLHTLLSSMEPAVWGDQLEVQCPRQPSPKSSCAGLTLTMHSPSSFPVSASLMALLGVPPYTHSALLSSVSRRESKREVGSRKHKPFLYYSSQPHVWSLVTLQPCLAYPKRTSKTLNLYLQVSFPSHRSKHSLSVAADNSSVFSQWNNSFTLMFCRW